MARFDAVAAAGVVSPTRIPTAAQARAYLESLPDLWAGTSDAGRRAIAEAVFERIDVLGVTDFTFALTARAKAYGWDAASPSTPGRRFARRAPSMSARSLRISRSSSLRPERQELHPRARARRAIPHVRHRRVVDGDGQPGIALARVPVA
jgi:hypothetical protein